MKASIHPAWNHNCKVTCACGNSFEAGSIQDSLEVDICSACHPFFTGEMRFVDTQGRVDKFMQKMEKAKNRQAKRKSASDNKPAAPAKSYKQLLQDQKKTLKTQAPANAVA